MLYVILRSDKESPHWSEYNREIGWIVFQSKFHSGNIPFDWRKNIRKCDKRHRDEIIYQLVGPAATINDKLSNQSFFLFPFLSISLSLSDCQQNSDQLNCKLRRKIALL